MARGDTRPYRGRGYSGGGYGSHYDDEGRGNSKTVWERYEHEFNAAEDKFVWAISIDNRFCHDIIRDTVVRYNLNDGPTYWNRADERGEEWVLERMKGDDSRVSRLNLKYYGMDKWLKVYSHILEGYEMWEAEEGERYRVIALERDKEFQEYAAEAAKRAKQVRIEEYEAIAPNVEMISGLLKSDLYEVMLDRDVYNLKEGDWIDDVTGAYTGTGGFAEEERHYASGNIKLQVTVSLDKSNSMSNNGIDKVAMEVFREIGLSLRELKALYPEDLFISFYTFSDGTDGKRVVRLGTEYKYLEGRVDKDYSKEDEYSLYEFEPLRPDRMNWLYFTGYDTWIYPLFENIKDWEDCYSEPGAARLDIIITDAVLEHPADIRQASQIQANRNGNLQTVLLNLLPEYEWVNSSLPYKCIQYGVTKENLANVLRMLLSEFMLMYI